MTRSIVITFTKYGLGLGLLAGVIWMYWGPGKDGSPGVGDVVTGKCPIQVLPLVLATSICLASLLLCFVRWWVLVRAQDLPFTLGDAFRLGLIGYFWNSFTPGSVGGDAVKAFYVAREQNRRTAAIATVLLDRAIGLWALFWFVAILGAGFWLAGNPDLASEASLATLWEQPTSCLKVAPLKTIILIAVALVVVTSLMWGVLCVLPERRGERFAGRLKRIPKVGTAASEFWRAVWMYRFRQRSLALAMVMALVGHVGWVLTFFFASQAFHEPDSVGRTIPSMTQHFLIVPVGMTWQALFPAPGGIGGGELGFGGLYALVGKPAANGVLGSLAQRMIGWAIALVGYVIYLRLPSESLRKARESIVEEMTPLPASTVNGSGPNGAAVVVPASASAPGEP